MTVSFLCPSWLDFLRFCELFQRFLKSIRAGNLVIKLLKILVSAEGIDLKLRRVLEHRGFMIKEIEGIGEAYHLLESTAHSLPSS